jgi:protein-S-isoprenylcysteine O-methyltransferase Ste14
MWARDAQLSDAWAMVIVWCAPLCAYPITLAGRRALAARPTIRRAEWVNIPVHYAMMISLGVGIFPAFRLVPKRPGIPIPVPPQVSLALAIVTGVAMFLTVLNLAVRGLGAPFAVKLSSRLATDWMYAWTRNPMLLCSLAWLFSIGLMYRSLWILVWLAVIVSPGWIFFVAWYEERELQIRFGAGYGEYRERTPFLWPRKPRPAGLTIGRRTAARLEAR